MYDKLVCIHEVCHVDRNSLLTGMGIRRSYWYLVIDVDGIGGIAGGCCMFATALITDGGIGMCVCVITTGSFCE